MNNNLQKLTLTRGRHGYKVSSQFRTNIGRVTVHQEFGEGEGIVDVARWIDSSADYLEFADENHKR